ncbi:MAG: UDP-N-acetylmuramate--L-alanine ligase [Geminicoccaceae bacterium]
MTALPLEVGTLHFVGIGGIGMSGIAEILCNQGYQVQGSDLADSANVKRLRDLGIKIAIGHVGGNLGDARAVVVSSAIKPDNPELVEARSRRLPVVRRADMLGELLRLKWSVAIAGTHGKTTTTSLIAALFEAAGLDPTVINGGIINAYGTNARLGSGQWMVVEADESDGTMVRLPATIAIVTNIDAEHLDHYGDFETLKDAFLGFLERLPFYGFAVLCIDHPEVQALVGKLIDRRIVTYGFNRQADIRASEPRFDQDGAEFDVELRGADGEVRKLDALKLAMPGRHNVQNALAAIAIARELDMTDDVIRQAFGKFEGVKRRFTRTGQEGGVTVIDDYGHHPVEIRSVLATARAAYRGSVIAVVQPHRYSRLADLFKEFCTAFNDADTVYVAPVYAAGESPIEGADHKALVQGLIDHGHRSALALDDTDRLADTLMPGLAAGDVIVCLGAGSITQWANALPGELKAKGFGA